MRRVAYGTVYDMVVGGKTHEEWTRKQQEARNQYECVLAPLIEGSSNSCSLRG
jgi:hypothetical protein